MSNAVRPESTLGGALLRSADFFNGLLDSAMVWEGSDSAVVAEVRIVGVEPGGVFRVRGIEIERGLEAAEDAQGLFDQASEWRVRVGTAATVLGASTSVVDRSQIAVGMRVKLHFPSLLSEPFPVAPGVEGAAMVVRPGRFRRVVSAASSQDGTFDATVESVDAYQIRTTVE